ncbi:MAG: hypothetical protein CVV44_07355 [Spirochaetae bacterium HGW-Spirochaetae-1]|nr:MAG: hypothetical protein CVV44_07355 [Spirochaetae bacterium HGW-Spirochaetae-1]
MRYLVTQVLISLLVFNGAALYARDGFRERQRDFILSLFNEGRYFDSIAEARKYMAFSGSRNGELDYFIAANYFLGGQYIWTIDHIMSRKDRLPDYREQILLSQSFMRLHDWGQSIAAVAAADITGVDSAYRYDVLLRQTEAYLYNDDFSEALDMLLRQKDLFGGKREFLSLVGDLEEYRKLHYRSGMAAGILSALLPGAGQMYAGRYTDGILSLLGVAATLFGGLYLYSRNEKGPAFSLFFFSGLFYGGTIYGAHNSCRTYNRTLNENFRKGILSEHVPAFDPMRYVDRNAMFR